MQNGKTGQNGRCQWRAAWTKHSLHFSKQSNTIRRFTEELKKSASNRVTKYYSPVFFRLQQLLPSVAVPQQKYRLLASFKSRLRNDYFCLQANPSIVWLYF